MLTLTGNDALAIKLPTIYFPNYNYTPTLWIVAQQQLHQSSAEFLILMVLVLIHILEEQL